MASDLSQDKRFTELPQRFQDELKNLEPTGMMGEDTWHEAQFEMDGIICQCAVVNRRWVALPKEDVERFGRIIRIIYMKK